MEITTILLLLCGLQLLTAASIVESELQVLSDSNFIQLDGLKALILINPTGITPGSDLRVDVMHRSGLIDLVGLLGPGSGFRGIAQAGSGEGTSTDPETDIIMYNAYETSISNPQHYTRKSGADSQEVLVVVIQSGILPRLT